MTEDRTVYDTSAGPAQVTNWDATAELLATWREKLPRITAAQAYAEAVKLVDALKARVEGFEKSAAFKRITGAQ